MSLARSALVVHVPTWSTNLAYCLSTAFERFFCVEVCLLRCALLLACFLSLLAVAVAEDKSKGPERRQLVHFSSWSLVLDRHKSLEVLAVRSTSTSIRSSMFRSSRYFLRSCMSSWVYGTLAPCGVLFSKVFFF